MRRLAVAGLVGAVLWAPCVRARWACWLIDLGARCLPPVEPDPEWVRRSRSELVRRVNARRVVL